MVSEADLRVSDAATPPHEFKNFAIPFIATDSIDRCIVCGGREFTAAAEGYDYELRTCRNRWIFMECRGCRHLQLDPRPASGTLPIIYPPNYYSYDMEKSINAVALAGKRMLDQQKFAGILKLFGGKPTSYLDIGCGDMRYLRVLQRAGVTPENLYGLELDDRVVEKAKQEGFSVFNERVETATSIPAASIDLATMFHVIEHVADPALVLKKIRTWLRPGGVVVIETPNVASLDAELFRKRYWGGYHIPRHWHLFRPSNLQRLLEEHGFAIEAVRYQTGHSFWLFSVHHWLRYNRVLPSPLLSRLFDPARSLPLLVLATGFDKVRAALGFRTSAMMFVARLR
jgi:2-polyprenyl-3-methyl-5-hydroxy-6-metoxy-1,4-benzoquinol methylase